MIAAAAHECRAAGVARLSRPGRICAKPRATAVTLPPMSRRVALAVVLCSFVVTAAVVAAVASGQIGDGSNDAASPAAFTEIVRGARLPDGLPIEVIVVLSAPSVADAPAGDIGRRRRRRAVAAQRDRRRPRGRHPAARAPDLPQRAERLLGLRSARRTSGGCRRSPGWPASTRCAACTRRASSRARSRRSARGARPQAPALSATGKGVSVALLDGPLDTSHPYLTGATLTPWNAVTDQPREDDPDAGRREPRDLHGRHHRRGRRSCRARRRRARREDPPDPGHGDGSRRARGIHLVAARRHRSRTRPERRRRSLRPCPGDRGAGLRAVRRVRRHARGACGRWRGEGRCARHRGRRQRRADGRALRHGRDARGRRLVARGRRVRRPVDAAGRQRDALDRRPDAVAGGGSARRHARPDCQCPAERGRYRGTDAVRSDATRGPVSERRRPGRLPDDRRVPTS